MDEIWKDIEGYDGLYQVSNLGRVKTFQFNKGRIMKGYKTPLGYMMVCHNYSEVGRHFNVNPGTIWAIINGKSWRGVV